MKTEPFPGNLFASSTRAMFILAHQDDELAYAGLIQRLSPNTRFVWVTNGDGLADRADMKPQTYASARHLETLIGMKTLGIKSDRLRFLGASEGVIYRNLVKVATNPKSRHEVFHFFTSLATQVTAEILSFRPDVVFTHSWQGGNPEHDLTHVMARIALEKLPQTVLYEVPNYELANTIFLRFPPWHQDTVHSIRLTPSELTAKNRMARCYPTQDWIIDKMHIAMTVLGGLGHIVGRGFDADRFASVEYFSTVPRNRDYLKSPHGFDFLDYIGDDCDGHAMSYTSMVVPVIQALFKAGGINAMAPRV